MGSHERKVRHLNPAFAPVLLTKNGPLGAHVHVNKTETSYPLKVEIVSPPSPLIIRFTGYNHAPLLQLSWGKLRREPATRRLSPLYPKPIRTYHQSFLWLRPFTIFRVANYTLYRSDKTGPWCAAPKSGSHVNRLTGFSPPLDSRINYTPRRVGKVVNFHTDSKGNWLYVNYDKPPRKQDTTKWATLYCSESTINAVSATTGSVHPPEPQLSDFRGYSYQVMLTLSGSTSAISRSLELSLQSSLQLSLTVLVCYRFRVDIYLSPTLGCTFKQPDSKE
uniref:Fibronectin type-III domain-containing protein n=1 Tax=Heterorhabditis bacteriophora TaxID=37862 RepID=A0A1I7WDQ0_HETBA